MNLGFKAHYFEDLAKLEAGNFWFRSRNKLIIWALHKYACNLDSFLEIGCGTGFVISAISKHFPKARLLGSEYMEEGLVHARRRLPGAEFSQMDARNIPYISKLDAIGAFDVLEHIEEDEVVLQQIYKALKPEGVVFITVPQHQCLWSVVDEHACHVRRYSSKELHKKVCDAGFEVIRTTSFVSALLPAMFLSRFLQRNRLDINESVMGELRINPLLNKVFEIILNCELAFIRMGINFPAGGSRLVVAKKI